MKIDDNWTWVGVNVTGTAPCGSGLPLCVDTDTDRYFWIPAASGRLPEKTFDRTDIETGVRQKAIVLFPETERYVHIDAPAFSTFFSEAVRAELGDPHRLVSDALPSIEFENFVYLLHPTKDQAYSLLDTTARTLLYQAYLVLNRFMCLRQVRDLDKAERLLGYVQYASVANPSTRWAFHIAMGLLWRHSAPHHFVQRFELLVSPEFPHRTLNIFEERVDELQQNLPSETSALRQDRRLRIDSLSHEDRTADELILLIDDRRKSFAKEEDPRKRIALAQTEAAIAADRFRLEPSAFIKLARVLLGNTNRNKDKTNLFQPLELKCLACEPVTYLQEYPLVQIILPPTASVIVDTLFLITSKIEALDGPVWQAVRDAVKYRKENEMNREQY